MPRSYSFELTFEEVGEFFDAEVVDAAVDLVGRRAVGAISRRRRGAFMALEALVSDQGGQFKSRIEVDSDDPPIIVDAECTCGQGYDCPHCAAVALASIQITPARAKGSTSPAVRRQTAGERAAVAWALSLTEAARDAASVGAHLANSRAAEKKKPSDSQRLTHVIDLFQGEFVISSHVGDIKSDGSVVPRRKVVTPRLETPPKYVKDEDLPILIKANRARQAAGYSWGFGHAGKSLLSHEEWWQAIKLMLEAGTLFRANSDREDTWNPLPLRQGPPRAVVPAWSAADDVVVPVVEVKPFARFFQLGGLPLYMDTDTGELGRIESDLPMNVIKAWNDGPELSYAVVDMIAPALADSHAGLRLPPPPALDVEEIRPESFIPVLEIARRPPMTTPTTFFAYPSMTLGEVRFDYGTGQLLAPLAEGEEAVSTLYAAGKRRHLHRLPEAEAAALARLDACGLKPLALFLNPSTLVPLHRVAVVPDAGGTREGWANVIAGGALRQLEDEGWSVSFEDGDQFDIVEAESLYEDIGDDKEGGNDWFRFETGIVHEGRRISLLPALAAALGRLAPGEALPTPDSFDEHAAIAVPLDEAMTRFVKFPARRFYRVLAEIRHLLGHQGADDDGLPLHRIEAALLADSLGTTEREALRDLGSRLRGAAAAHDPPPLPDGLRATLRHYQADGYHWLQFLAAYGLHGVLADDMGLGKTMQTLAHLLREVEAGRHEGRPSLVVAPTSVLPNWQSEAARFAPSLDVLVLHGKERAEAFEDIPSHQLVVTSYPLLVRDEAVLAVHDYHVVVLDEAQAIKNPATKMARAACRLKARHRLCLSGTPLENHLGELWSLFRFLIPGFLGSREDFTKKFRTPIEKQGDPERREALHRKVRPLILRRTKDAVATELPPKTLIQHAIEINDVQQELYESVRAVMDKRVRDALAEQGAEKSHILFLQALLRLRQICCHPKLLGEESKAGTHARSAKLDYLEELLPVLLEEGRRILLFSQFTSMLDIIRGSVTRLGIPFTTITGSTTDRRTPVEDFQKGRVPLFLISLKAGGTGLNLTAADTVIHYDPWWNPAVENQATDRAHRIGQDKPVFVHRLICQGTIEQRIQELQERKAGLVSSLLEGTSTKIQLDEQTISDLLAPLG